MARKISYMNQKNPRNIRTAKSQDYEHLLSWRRQLWPKIPPETHENFLRDFLADPTAFPLPIQIFVAETHDLVGFIEIGLRSRADGCNPRYPVGYIEAWYVDPSHQHQGIGKELLKASEDWARNQGCQEMASDTWMDRPEAQKAHQALGFEIVDHCVHYRKSL